MSDHNLNGEPLNLDDENLETVAERPDEGTAAIVVSVLADEGIRAVATGGFTAGFRAEAPGSVKVKTLARDAERAKTIIGALKSAPTQWPDGETS